ncbi:unnamed protein product, partial [Nippostrongylus brasiliensis]|uniref:Late secretory pathway protein AVL9 homolog (inferred by orthology to a human protein) n=1 Tax=Nippostrongylus brasiliensis TaxID=27835 RepID=A0A0N4XSN9_NIPBR
VIFFVLPSRENPQEAVFGISCYRQISAKDLVARTDDVTRSTVQKSVCVLSRAPLFGALKGKLELITRAYFEERDFTKVEVLSQMYTNLCEMFNGDQIDEHAANMDISVQDLFLRFRHRALVLFKLLLLERKRCLKRDLDFALHPARNLSQKVNVHQKKKRVEVKVMVRSELY